PVDAPQAADSGTATSSDDTDDDADDSEDGQPRRRRRRGGRRRRKSGADLDADADTETTDDTGESAGSGAPAADDSSDDAESDSDDAGEGTGTSSRRRRRRRRRGEGETSAPDDSGSTAGQSGRVRDAKLVEDEITSVGGSTRLEAKKQRRREGREAGRRRAPIVSESEFLARREAVKREMVIRQKSDLTQIAVMEDDVLVEHYVARESQTSLIGNIYLGRVQNVLPSMEAAFVDIGKGRNAVLYAGEVDWKTLGNGKQRKIEDVLKSGQSVLVQVTKDPIGHKGARLTSQISLAGRFLVYVPGGQTNGISRKLPDTERNRLKGLLKEVLPEDAGVIIRTAAEGASEEQLTRDVGALTARWDDIERKSAAGGKAPQLLYGEPDLTLKVVRDLFNEDFEKLVIQGDDAWDMVKGYVDHVAPDLAERAVRWDGDRDAFAAHRVDEQIAKALDRKVWLPSGGSLIIDRTEAMTVVDVNTGKFTGSGGNLEETVTKNNLEAAEEIVRQLRLRDIGGIIVVDFIDMVLESNRDLVLRRMVECLGRDRTRHQVAEVTSLGLVQMTRKRIGTGLLEAFSEPCPHCHGRGLVTHDEPVEHRHDDGAPAPRGGRKRGDGANQGGGNQGGGNQGGDKPAPETSGDAPSPRTTGRRGGRGSGRAPSEATPADVAPLEVPVPQAPAPDEAGRPVDHEPPSPGTTEVTTVVVEATEGAEAATAPVEPTEPAEPTEAVEPVKAPAKRATRAPRRATRKAAAPTPTAEVPPVLTGDDPTP
ncbi:MAG: Rne/Rng family ribonuclease, partial [Nocardioidaceae bacterium]|nr:Rne/Rng family ribonuclease [Nocardioidaceae bacterium]